MTMRICAKAADCSCKKRKGADTQKERHFFEKDIFAYKLYQHKNKRQHQNAGA